MELLVSRKRKRLLRELPEEVISDEILTRLPIKSVVRFKSVSKSWLSVLSSSSFIKEHSIRSPMQNPNDYDRLVADKYNHISIFSRSQETFVLCTPYDSLIGSVNGLVCFLRDFDKVSLWNPAIHQSMELNLPQDECPSLSGIAFDHGSNDCKVVVCYPLLDACAVYSSNSNSWIQLSIPDHEFLMNKFEKSGFIPTTYVKDCPYWTDYSAKENKVVTSLAVLKFDATSNKLKLLPKFFPDARSRERGKIFKFVNMRDLLTLLAYEPSPTGKLDVYSLDEEKGCGVWIKMHQVGPFEEFGAFEYLQQGFKYGDEIVFTESGKLHLYDHKTDTFMSIPGKEAYIFSNCFTYTPSMVFLKGMGKLH